MTHSQGFYGRFPLVNCQTLSCSRFFGPNTHLVQISTTTMRITLLCFLGFIGLHSTAQGTVKGLVRDEKTRVPLPFVNVLLEGTTLGATSDINGAFVVEGVKPGLYNVVASSVGYVRRVVPEVQVGTARPVELEILLEASATELKEVEIKPKAFQRSAESPLSVRTIGSAEIMRNPGGNRDISKVIRSLPGVASTASFRNDIIIRGGAPNENRFYLDGIEVPTINHFSTQGSSGGPVGMINVNFIREVDVITGAFPAARGNTLSSVFEFKQPEGNTEKRTFTFMAGSSDLGFTFDGPTGAKASTILSVRRSYLQFLFQALKLPFLPIYNDAQVKHTIRLNDRSRLTFIGLGAYDNVELNPAANDDVTDQDRFERNRYILGNLPENAQWNYTVGARYDRFVPKGLHTIVVSRSHLFNEANKFRNNDKSDPSALLLRYGSQEEENKFRYEVQMTYGEWRFVGGANAEHARYSTDTYGQRVVNGLPVIVAYESALSVDKFGAFGQLSRSFGKLSGSFGLRTDVNTLRPTMSDPIDQLSPRLSLSYAVSDAIAINANAGRFHQLPPYTVLGFRDQQGAPLNLDGGIRYIQADHAVLGVEYYTKNNGTISVEGFHKWYDRYPLLVDKGVSLANLGGDFGVIGNELAVPTSKGRSYGVEFLAQQKLYKGFYGILSYTFVKSEFTNASGQFAPSSWDFGHILNLTGGKRLPKDWEIGLNWRMQGGGPYTPFDQNASSLIVNWESQQQGVLDFVNINTMRLRGFNQLNVRVDKRYYFKGWTLNVYLDVENVLASELPGVPFLDVVRNATGEPAIDPADPSRYQLREVSNNGTTVLPSIGLMIEI